MNAIAAAELRMLVRNRTVAGAALLFPMSFGVFLCFSRGAHERGGAVAGVQIILMVAMGTYVTVTTTLASRRQTLYLKRMRGGAVSDRAIIAGLVAPPVGVNLVQLAIVLGVLAYADVPSNPLLLVAAIVIAQAMFAGLALATAGLSASPEHAQYTTAPIFLVATAAAVWFQATGTDHLIAVKRTLPGGALAELVETAWDGGGLSTLPLLLPATLGWTVVGVLAARAFFRWEPRQ
ncbi:ABC transporter permease [Catenulispora subtropica]|uniref:ABC transporter permease n=1 Tax=Catenulispora subtropica TaxID=450798 RepID=A0ABP5CCT1_9ACTN